MKWNLIKLLCEYSDDFSSEPFKDLVDSIDMKHLFGNQLLDDFIGFVDAFSTFESDVFVHGFSDSTELVDNGISKEQIEQHKLNKDKLRGFHVSRELRRLVNDLVEDDEILEMLNNKAKSHFKQYQQTLSSIFKQSIALNSISATLWSDDSSFVDNVKQLEKLARILITVDLQDVPNGDAKIRLTQTLSRIDNTLSGIDLTHIHDIEKSQRVARKGKYEDEVKISDHTFLNTNYFKIPECNDLIYNIIHSYRKLGKNANKFNLSNRISMARQEGTPPFDPNNPPADFINLIHQTEQIIVDIAEELDLI